MGERWSCKGFWEVSCVWSEICDSCKLTTIYVIYDVSDSLMAVRRAGARHQAMPSNEIPGIAQRQRRDEVLRCHEHSKPCRYARGSRGEKARTLPVALAMFHGYQSVDLPHLFAAATLATLPVIVVFLVFQRQIIAGLTAGAVKG